MGIIHKSEPFEREHIPLQQKVEGSPNQDDDGCQHYCTPAAAPIRFPRYWAGYYRDCHCSSLFSSRRQHADPCVVVLLLVGEELGVRRTVVRELLV
ncbi:hypothetical protein N7535_009506 [Penicillium sp. DV-2018c]|nr:hypothetical protein N7535_009506 [Penicillium sp. DV-2018c]